MRHISGTCLALASALAAGCASEPVGLEYPVEVRHLESRVLHVGDHLGGPTALEVAGSRLLVLDTNGDRGLHVVDLDDGARIASVGSVGDGPAEFRAPYAITIDPEGRPWVSDLGQQRLTRIDLGRLEDPTAWAAELMTFRDVPWVMDLVWTANRTILAGGGFSDARFGILAADGRLTEVRGAFPDLAGDAPASVLQQIYMAEIATKPDMSAIVSASRWDDRVEILSPDGRLVREIAAPIPVTPEYDVIDRGGYAVAGFDRSRAAYVSVAATDDLIFALFSARTAEEWEDRQLFGRDVHVFDWSGRLVSVLRLDRDALVLTVDPDRGRLLTVEYEPVPAILAYEIPRLAVPRAPERVAVLTVPGGDRDALRE